MAAMRIRVVTTALAGALVLTAAGSAFAQAAAAPEQLGALAPANLKKPRPKAPFDLTGTWQHDGRFSTWKFIPDNTIAPGTCYPIFSKPVGMLFLKPSQNDQGEEVNQRKNTAKRWQSMVVGMCIPEPQRVNTCRVAYTTPS